MHSSATYFDRRDSVADEKTLENFLESYPPHLFVSLQEQIFVLASILLFEFCVPS
jgi:hypothetical protein